MKEFLSKSLSTLPLAKKNETSASKFNNSDIIDSYDAVTNKTLSQARKLQLQGFLNEQELMNIIAIKESFVCLNDQSIPVHIPKNKNHVLAKSFEAQKNLIQKSQLFIYSKLYFLPWQAKTANLTNKTKITHLTIAICDHCPARMKLIYEYCLKHYQLDFSQIEIIIICKKLFFATLESGSEGLLLSQASEELAKKSPKMSAKNHKILYFLTLPIFSILIYAVGLVSGKKIVLFFSVLSCLISLLKFYLFLFAITVKQQRKNDSNHNLEEVLTDHQLPIYTILVPLYKEPEKFLEIINNLKRFDYPAEKLDIKIILEQKDELTKNVAELIVNMPINIDLIYVPESIPKTKPKALNYALNFAKGQYVVVYDAEDIPCPGQLKQAVRAFRRLPNEYICLQAKLNFWNSEHNILTKCFSIEYGVLFDYFLESLAYFRLPIMLGGTSNHYKVKELKHVGNWDAYNITEDADLGLRIASLGYLVGSINSVTLEECLIDSRSWLKQRVRWIQGFIITSCVILSRAKEFCQDGKSTLAYIHIIFYMVLGTMSIIFNPVINIFLLYNLFNGSGIILTIIFFLLNMNNILITAIYQAGFGVVKFIKYLPVIIFSAFYLQIMLSLAGYTAIFGAIFMPFKWNKTKHGVYELGFNKMS